MKGWLRFSSLMILALGLFFSCSRPSFTLMGIHTSVTLVSLVDSEGNLTASYESLGVFIESEGDATLQMEVTSPDFLNTWLFQAMKKSADKQDYYGKSGLSLGSGMPLPRGQWSVRILRDDGRTITESFFLEKGSQTQAFEHHLDAQKGLLVLDSQLMECSLQLLDEKKNVLHRSTTTEQMIDLTSLYPKWDKVRFVGLSWYDEAARMSQMLWYAL